MSRSNWKPYVSTGFPAGRPEGVRNWNTDFQKHIDDCRTRRICLIRRCHRVGFPFCPYHEKLYRWEGKECYNFYLNIHLGSCGYCGIPIDKQERVVCELHRVEYVRRVRQALERCHKGGTKASTLTTQEYRWKTDGPPIHLRAWEWGV